MSITFIRRADSHGDHILPISIAIHSPCNTSKQAHTHRYPFTLLSSNDNTNWYHLYLRLTHSISGSFSPWSEHDFNNVISVKSICNDLSPSKHLLVKLKNQSQYRSRKLTDYEMNLWNFSTEIQTRRIEVFVFISAKSIGHFVVLQHSWPSQIESLLSMQAFRSDDSIKRFNSAIFLFVSLFASKLW